MRRSFALALGLLAVAPATAAATAGGASYPRSCRRTPLRAAAPPPAPPATAAATAGGASYPGSGGGTAYGAASTSRPTVTSFRVAARVREGRLPLVRFRIDEPGGDAVSVRIAVLPLGGHTRGPLSVPLGRQATGRTVTVSWPRGTRIAVGRWLVRLHAVDGLGRPLLRPAHASGR